MKKNPYNELKDKILSKINSFITGPTPQMTPKALDAYLRVKEDPTDCLLDVKDGSRDIVVISKSPKKPVPLSSMNKSELFGAPMTDRLVQTFGDEFDALSAVIAQHYTVTQAKKRKAGQQRQKGWRERRRADIKAGNPRRLDFLWEAFRMKGISTDYEIARRVGCTPQNINHLKLTDNLKLSALEQMLACIGLKVELSLKNTGEAPVWSRNRQVKFHIGGHKVPQRYDYLKPALNGRLACLAREVIWSGINLKSFCDRANLPYHRTRNALVNDDIFLSKLEQTAEKLDRILILEIREM